MKKIVFLSLVCITSLNAFRVEFRTPPTKKQVGKEYESLQCKVRVSYLDAKGNRKNMRKRDYMVKLNQCGDHGTACKKADMLKYNIWIGAIVSSGEGSRFYHSIGDNQTLPCNVLLTYVLDEDIIYCAVEQQIVKAWKLSNPERVPGVNVFRGYKFNSTEQFDNPYIGKKLFEVYPNSDEYWKSKPEKKCSAN